MAHGDITCLGAICTPLNFGLGGRAQVLLREANLQEECRTEDTGYWANLQDECRTEDIAFPCPASLSHDRNPWIQV